MLEALWDNIQIAGVRMGRRGALLHLYGDKLKSSEGKDITVLFTGDPIYRARICKS